MSDDVFVKLPEKMNCNGAVVDDDRLDIGWFAIRHDVVCSKNGDHDKLLRRRLHGRLCRISSAYDPERSIIRILRFSGTLHRDRIALDRTGWLNLCDFAPEPDKPIALRISLIGDLESENPLAQLRFLWGHPDPERRFSFRISVLLGAISLLLGCLSIVISIVQ